jgi:DNA-binding MarR family transcriptional regulator
MSSAEGTSTNMTPKHPMADRLGYVLKQAQHALRTSMDEKLSHLGVTTAQFNVLSAVQRQPGISNACLARGAFVTAQSMLGIVANLEKMRLLHRTPHQTHGRIMQSELTEKGTDVLASARQAIDDVEKCMTVGFTAEEIRTLRSMLQRCAQNMHSAKSRLLK